METAFNNLQQRKRVIVNNIRNLILAEVILDVIYLVSQKVKVIK